jgi:hypothetical protein
MSLTDNRKTSRAVNGWLEERGISALAPIEDFCSGDKHPQMTILSGGYNCFPNKEFVEFFKTIRWEWPENAILVLKPEDGPTEVYRG